MPGSTSLQAAIGLLIPWLPEPSRWGVNALGNSSLALFYGCVLLVAVTERGGLLSLAMRLKPLRLLAPIAFGVFLFHVPVLAAVSGLAEGDTTRPEAWLDVAMKLSAFAATVALATVSWIFFESRIVAWGARSGMKVLAWLWPKVTKDPAWPPNAIRPPPHPPLVRRRVFK